MKIKSTITDRLGKVFDLEYEDIDSEEQIRNNKKVHVVHGFCFYGDKMVIVYNHLRKSWTPPGGSMEEGETAEEAIIREIKEESNMKVLTHKFIGVQYVFEPEKTSSQTRSFCRVEPYGEFTKDPDEDITEIKLIDPADYKQYFNWGEVGEYIMKRALQFLEEGKIAKKESKEN